MIERAIIWYREKYRENSKPRSWRKIAEDIVFWKRAERYFPELKADPLQDEASIKGKADSGWPLTGQTLERWIDGMSIGGGKRKHTRPKPQKLLAIAEFLIEKDFLRRQQLEFEDEISSFYRAIQDFMEEAPVNVNAIVKRGHYERFSQTDFFFTCERQEFFHDEGRDSRVIRARSEELLFKRSQFHDEVAFKQTHGRKRPHQRITRSGLVIPFGYSGAILFLKPTNARYGDYKFQMLGGPPEDREGYAASDFRSILLTYLSDYFSLLENNNEVTIWHRAEEPRNEQATKVGRAVFGAGRRGELVEEFGDRLIKAVWAGDTDDVKLCLALGADPNFRDPRNSACAIHIAAATACEEIADVLLSHPDFDPLVLDGSGFYPSDLATADRDLADKLYRVELKNAEATGRHYRTGMDGYLAARQRYLARRNPSP